MSAEQANLWDGLVQMGRELKRTHSAGLLSAALTFAYVCIDTMSYLSLPDPPPVSWTLQIARKCGRSVPWPSANGEHSPTSTRQRRCG
jgi:hypothetical protein